MSKTQTVRLTGDLDSGTLHEVAATVSKELADEASVEIIPTDDFTVGSYPTDAAALAGILAATIKAVLYIRHSLSARAWDERRLLDVIKSTLADRGITDYRIVDIKNLSGLRGEGTAPCTITVESGNSTFQVNVFIDGTVFTFDLSGSTAEGT